MNTYTKKLLIALGFCLTLISAKAQLPYSEDFDNGVCNTAFPGNWTTGSTTGDWLIDDGMVCTGGVPQCTVVGSSGGSCLAGGDGTGLLESAVSASFSTTGFSNITVDWNGYRTSGAPTVTFEVSYDDITYTVVPFTDVVADDNWHALSTITLPSSCDNVPKLYLRWSYNSTNAGLFMAFDDLVVNGTSLTTFFWNGGALHQTTSWGVNPNGTGANPTNFTTGGYTFNLYNNTATNFAAVLTAPWALSGGTVNLNLGDGTTRNTSLTIPSGFALTLTNATCNVASGSTLSLVNTTFPPASAVTLASGSTIEFAQTSTVSLYSGKTFHNLTISGNANKSQNGNTIVNGVLNLASSSSNFVMANSSLQSLTLNGTIAGSGALLTGNSRLIIGGTGSFGTVTFGVGTTTRTINGLTVNRTSSGLITLGSNLTVTGTSAFTNGTITLGANLLSCNGAVTFPASSSNGAFVGSTSSSLSVAGAGAISNSIFFDQSSSTTRCMKDITLNRSGSTMTLGNALDIWGTIRPQSGTIAAGSGLLTIKNDNTTKGRVGVMSATGFLTGAGITVETMAKGGVTGWTTLGSAGITGRTFADWNDDFKITCASCPDGSVVASTPFTSISSYDETAATGNYADAAHYVDITSISTSMGVGQGWWVYLGNGNVSTTDILVDVTGSVSQGNLTSIPLTVTGGASAQNGWNLLANPFPSPVSFSSMISGNTGNCENTLYVWNPDLNGGNGDFAIYTPSVGSVPSVASGGVDDNIPTGQGFYIRATTPFNLNPVETWKSATASSNPMLKTNSAASYPTNMFILNLTGSSMNFNTMTAVNINANATSGYDNVWDAHHLSPGYGIAEIFTSNGPDQFKLNSIPTINGSVSIPVTVLSGYSGSYQIAPLNLNNLPAGACVNLYDRFTNTTHNLKSGPYNFTFSDTTTVNRFLVTITINQTSINSSATNPACTKNLDGKIIASGTTAGPWNYVWKDGSNAIVKTTNNVSTPDTLKNLGAGTYYVDVNTVGTCDNASASYNIVVTSPLPTSAFSVNADSLDIAGSTPFMFTNASTNASNYTWYFGDGNTSSQSNPNYMYSTAGEYDVFLYAVNPACGDSSVSNYHVKAYSTGSPTTTSVNNLSASDNSIRISKDINGIYVQFNYDKSTKATVSVTNVLGQTLISPKAIEGTTERFYIDVNSKDQVLFVTVTTGEKRITERLLNN